MKAWGEIHDSIRAQYCIQPRTALWQKITERIGTPQLVISGPDNLQMTEMRVNGRFAHVDENPFDEPACQHHRHDSAGDRANGHSRAPSLADQVSKRDGDDAA